MPSFSGGDQATFSYNGTDLSDFISSVSLDTKRDIKDLQVIGGNAVSKIVGPISATINLEGFFDPTLDAALAPLILATTPTAHAFSYVPQGTGDTFTGTAFLASYRVDTPGDDSAKWRAELAITGAITGP